MSGMKRKTSVQCIWAALALVMVLGAGAPAYADLRSDFKTPPQALKSQPFWHMNGKLTTAEIKAQLQHSCQDSRFGGVAVLPVGEMAPAYLSEDYFARYGEILQTASQLGLEVILYDDTGFPSGSAGGEFARRFPDLTAKQLDKAEEDVVGPKHYTRALPPGTLMGAVAMNQATKQRVNITNAAKGNSLSWEVPDGDWKIMIFTCVPGFDWVDYMSPEAVNKFISLTYDRYYAHFSKYFGTTIKRCFYDDISMMYTKGYRTWTPAFNEKFQKKNGINPILYYPALWYDIGPDTQAARVALFGFRAELMAEGYPKQIAEWCHAHRIRSTGHPAGNYEPTPVDMGGDNIKFYRHSDMPLLDAIFYHGHGRDGFKLVSSAACTYDRPRTAAEVFGAYSEDSMNPAMLYRNAMELYARGVNFLVPHAMWYDPAHVSIPPLISYLSPKLGPELANFNNYVARLSLFLQGGRHVADIGMLYPIDSLEAFYHMDAPENTCFGTYVPPETDYLRVSNILTGGVRRDFTFLHPDALDTQCTVDGPSLRLNNKINYEQYKVLIIPGGKTIALSNLKKIKQFYDNGGTVIGTTQLPYHSAEFGHDTEVKNTVQAMFGIDPTQAPIVPAQSFHVKIEVTGPVIRTFINSTLVDTTVDTACLRGGVGFYEGGGEIGTVDNVKVTKLGGGKLLGDDFSGNLAQWTDAAKLKIEQGALKIGSNQWPFSVAGADWTDYAFEADVKITRTSVGLIFRNVDGDNLYIWQFKGNGQMWTQKKVHGNMSMMKEIYFTDMLPGTCHLNLNGNGRGGKACFVSAPTVPTLQKALAQDQPVCDVRFENNDPLTSGNGMLSYIHKVKDGKNIYFFANSTNDRVDTWVRLKGKLKPELWDPHTGQSGPVEYQNVKEAGQAVTRVRLQLAPVASVLIVEAGARKMTPVGD